MPVVTLERAVEGAWEPVLRKNGAPVNSRGPEMVLRLEPDPPYGESSDARTYYWVLWLGLDRVAESDVDELSGSVRIQVDGMAEEAYSLTSSSVEL